MTMKVLLLLILIFLIFKLYRFSSYIKKYLYVYNLDIIENQKEDDKYELEFTVQFAKGYFRKEYFNAIGKIKSDTLISNQKLREILSLTEIDKFLNPSIENIKKNHFNYKYTLATNINKPADEITVKYQIILNELIDILRNSQY